jgi:hypothetical protein
MLENGRRSQIAGVVREEMLAHLRRMKPGSWHAIDSATTDNADARHDRLLTRGPHAAPSMKAP